LPSQAGLESDIVTVVEVTLRTVGLAGAGG